jgi:hypothetical protein
MPQQPAHRIRRKPGFFHPVPVRARRDGWTVVRQCAFLAQLYLTGSVAAAAHAVGMTRESAHRLRRREGAEGFARQWDRVLTPPGLGHVNGAGSAKRKVTLGELRRRFEQGMVAPVIHCGRMTAIREKADNSALLDHLRRTNANVARVERSDPGAW